jgi:hypothetical protein
MRKPTVVVATALGVATASLAAVTIATATSANAQSSAEDHIGYITQATTSYVYPTNQSTPVHYGFKAGDQVVVRCFTEGQELQGNHYWFRITKDGNLGFVHRSAMATATGIPHC